MSTVHYSASELANIVSVLYVRHYDNRAGLVKTMADVATVNAFAVNARYNESTEAVTAAEIDALVTMIGSASLSRAIGTATMLEYNCDGFMNDRLSAEIGRICGQLARKADAKVTEQREYITHLQTKLSEADKEIAALKVKPARKPRAVKGA